MSQIQVDARVASIPVQNLAEFKRLAAQALESAKGEPGTVQYAWFFNDDETACIAREMYEDSAAALAHVANLGDLFGQLLEVSGGCKFEVFGDPSAEFVEATRGLDIAFFRYFHGK